jgi:predicted CXXCH cytochrome family protein
VVGKIQNSEDITVLVNDKAVYVNKGLLIKLKTEDGIFYLFKIDVELTSGINRISITGSSINKILFVQYDKSGSRKSLNNKKTFFHMNDNNFFCKKCHDFNNAKECGNCHENNIQNKYVHGPVVALQCFICHDKNNYFSIKQPLSVHCLKCHQEFSDAMYNAKFAHAPSVAGYCTVCHNPHVSSYKFFLINNIKNLCIKCHEYKKTGYHVARKYIKEHKNISCTKCHNPHYGKTSSLLKDNGNKKKLCKRCHH